MENPMSQDYINIIDGIGDYNLKNDLKISVNEDLNKNIEKNEDYIFKEDLVNKSIKKEIDDNNIEISSENDQKAIDNIKDDELESIIQSVDEDYKKIEKERFNEDNKLKLFDDHKLPNDNNVGSEIVDYIKTTNIGIKSQEELYSLPIDKISDAIKIIVNTEAPIHINEVNNRFKENCNIKRAGVKLKKIIFLAIEKAEQSGDIIKIDDFLYDVTNNIVLIRKRDKPNIDLISKEEISKSIRLVLSNNSNISTKQLVKETSRNFGFKSTSKKTAMRINGVLDLMIGNNIVEIDNDYVEFK